MIGRVARRIWAIAMRERYGASERSQKLKYHVQTSGRSLHAQEMAFNDCNSPPHQCLRRGDHHAHRGVGAPGHGHPAHHPQGVGAGEEREPRNQGSFIVIQELTDLVEEAVLAEFERLHRAGWRAGRDGDALSARQDSGREPPLRVPQALGRAAVGGRQHLREPEIVVRVKVRIELYVPWGQYRVTVEGLDVNYTLGEAARRREETIRRLGERGLLKQNDRLEVTPLPLRVGLITSLNSDAYNDVLRTLRESGFAFDVTVHGARVQGRATEPSVLNALDWFRDRAEQFDTILICRGGGSRTDLVWFDTEPLGAAVATFPLPVLIGIGHEQDLSVLDAVARSYKTPTATAAWLVDQVREALGAAERTATQVLEMAVSRIEATRERLMTIRQRLLVAGEIQLRRERTSLRHFALRIPGAAGLHIRHQTHAMIENRRRMAPISRRLLAHATEAVDARARQLHAVDPRRVVERGFAVLRNSDGRVLSSVRTHLRQRGDGRSEGWQDAATQ